MTCAEGWQLGLQAVTAVALVATFIVYWRQLRTMQGQLKESRAAGEAQNTLALATFLQSPDVREARHVLRDTLSAKRYDSWTEDESRAATLVCSSYDLVAILLREGIGASKPIVDNWGPSIRDCYEVVRPLLDDLRSRSKSGPTYWKGFDWLYAQASAAA